jgi:hypothetical protein
MFTFVGAFLAQLVHDVVAFIRLPAALALLLRSPHATPTSTPPPSAIMPPRAKGSKAIDLAGDFQRRQMVHIKTKEECRLANETIDVWSIELPSKHAEAILKCVSPPPAICQTPQLPSAICHLLFVICCLRFAICDLLTTNRCLLTANYHLPTAICPAICTSLTCQRHSLTSS